MHASGVLGPLADLTFILLTMAAVGCGAWGLHRYRPRPRWPWVLIIVAFVLFLAGGVERQIDGTLGNLTDSRSLIPDLLIMPGYISLGLGLVGLARTRAGKRDVDGVLDATLAGLAALTVAWVYLINPALSQQHTPLTVRLLLAFYPPLSVFLLTIGIRMAFNMGGSSPLTFKLVVLALGAMLFGDVAYMAQDAQLADLPIQVLDVPYGLAYLLIAVGMMHPSMRWVSEPVLPDESSGRRGRLVLVALALCIPAVVSLTRTDTDTADRLTVAGIVLALTLTAALRVFRALREHARSEDRLAHQATHDPLTGLPNRLLIKRHLEHTLATQRDGRLVALLFIDVDRFRLVNDTMGHGTGDELLIAAARRLEQTQRRTDLVGRVGGDEFVILVRDATDVAEVLEIAERTRLGFVHPFRVTDHEIQMSASIGVAVQSSRDEGGSAETMFRDADTAMYQAKDAGGDVVAEFDSSVRVRIAERMAMEGELRMALERGELHLHYQPVVHVHDGRILGFEALLRWTHPKLGNLPPDSFIPIAEDTGLIVEIGAWVLNEACAELARLYETVPGAKGLYMSVNVSARQLRKSALIDDVARALLRHHIPGEMLCLELTESVLMEEMEEMSAVLASLRQCGVRISIDDFGTGYSSLAYLKQLPVDEVKIDRSFVVDITSGASHGSLVAAVVAIAASLGISTVAEGVEEQDQADALHALGCDKSQGYLFSRPVPPSELPAVIGRLGMAHDPHIRIVPSSA